VEELAAADAVLRDVDRHEGEAHGRVGRRRQPYREGQTSRSVSAGVPEAVIASACPPDLLRWENRSIRDLCGWMTGDDMPAFP